MPELRSGARQPRSPPLVPAVAAARDTVPARRVTPRRRVGGAAGGGVGGTAAAAEEAGAGVGAGAGASPSRVRTRAAVAKEAAVVTTRVAGRGKGGGAGSGRGAKAGRNAKSLAQAKGGGSAGAAKARPVGRGKQVTSRSQSPEQEPLDDPCTSEDNIEADSDLGEGKQEAGVEEIREMEEESAGRSAEKVAGAGDDDGSAAPLPDRVIGATHLLFCWLVVAIWRVELWIMECVISVTWLCSEFDAILMCMDV